MLHIYIYDISCLRVNDLTLILLTWRKWWANNASKQQMGFNSGFKGLRLRNSALCRPFVIHCVTVGYAGRGRTVTTVLVVNKILMKNTENFCLICEGNSKSDRKWLLTHLRYCTSRLWIVHWKPLFYIPIWFQIISSNTNLISFVDIWVKKSVITHICSIDNLVCLSCIWCFHLHRLSVPWTLILSTYFCQSIIHFVVFET